MGEAKATQESGACGRAASTALAGTWLQFWDFSQAACPVADHRPIELFRLQKTSKIKKSYYQATITATFTKPYPQELYPHVFGTLPQMVSVCGVREDSWKWFQRESAAQLSSPASCSVFGDVCPALRSVPSCPAPSGPRGLTLSLTHPGKRSTSFEYRFSTSSDPRRTFHDTRAFSRFSTFSLGVDTKANLP